MRALVLVLGITSLTACQKPHGQAKVKPVSVATETIPVTKKTYSYLNELERQSEYRLVKETVNDSLLNFYYFQDTVLRSTYSFNIWQGAFELIQNNVEPVFAIVDTIEIQLKSDRLTVFKYELLIPPIDGAGCCLFNKEYGLLASSNYTWGRKVVLTTWDNTDLESGFADILIADSQNYLGTKRLTEH